MSSVHNNSVETVNAAATAIVTAETRVQPSTVQKRRWRSWWSLYWCFGSQKPHSKRIGHAILISETAPQNPSQPVITENPNNHSSTIVTTIPFIAPPSSPASFLHSEPPSGTHSPATSLSLSVQAFSQCGTAPIFTIGPYAHETQLVSPPVFSTFTTEPSTANFTPPPEPVQMTTPSSPEVPFAQLLSSSLAKNRRFSGTHVKYPLSQYEYQPYQYSGSSGGGSRINSGTSSPFIGYEHFISNYKWGSRVGSGSLTPSGGLSRLGSGNLTPNGGNNNLLENQISEVASLANSDHGSDANVVDHRVSFELIGEDIPTCVIREAVPSCRTGEGGNLKDLVTKNEESSMSKEFGHNKNRTISLGSSKDFNFDNAKGEEVTDKSSVDCEWWTNEKVVSKEIGPRENNNWTFFPMLQPGVS